MKNHFYIAFVLLIGCTPAPKPQHLISTPSPVPKPTYKTPKQCRVSDDESLIAHNTTDPNNTSSFRKVVCMKHTWLDDQQLDCKTLDTITMQKIINVVDPGMCGVAQLTKNADMCGPIKHSNKQCCYAVNIGSLRCVD